MDKKLTYIIIGVVILVTFILLIMWNISNNKKNPILIDQNSTDRMTELNNILTSILGSKWPYLLFLFCIILIIFFYILYILSIKGININIDENHYKLFSILFIIFLVLFVILIIILTVMNIQNQKYNNQYCVQNYKPADDTSSSNMQTLQIIGLSIFILAALGGGGYYFFFLRNK